MSTPLFTRSVFRAAPGERKGGNFSQTSFGRRMKTPPSAPLLDDAGEKLAAVGEQGP